MISLPSMIISIMKKIVQMPEMKQTPGGGSLVHTSSLPLDELMKMQRSTNWKLLLSVFPLLFSFLGLVFLFFLFFSFSIMFPFLILFFIKSRDKCKWKSKIVKQPSIYMTLQIDPWQNDCKKIAKWPPNIWKLHGTLSFISSKPI